jgi:hypothetical protein
MTQVRISFYWRVSIPIEWKDIDRRRHELQGLGSLARSDSLHLLLGLSAGLLSRAYIT